MNNKIVLCNPSYTDLKEFVLKKSDIFDISYTDNFSSSLKLSGFLLIIRRKDLPLENINNYQQIHLKNKIIDCDLITFDKKYRHKLKYKYIIIIDRHYRQNKDFIYDKFNHTFLSDDIIIKDINNTNKLIELYKTKPMKLSSKRRNNIEKIYNFIKNKDIITSKEIALEFKISIRTVERDMIVLNEIYNCIGYNPMKKNWYIIKK